MCSEARGIPPIAVCPLSADGPGDDAGVTADPTLAMKAAEREAAR